MILMGKLEKMLYIVTEDGEIVDSVSSDETVAKLKVGDRILRRDAIIPESKMVDLKMRFIKVNPDWFGSVATKNPPICNLLPYIEYQTGRLVFDNGVTINRRNLARACGVSRNTIDRRLRGWLEDDILKVVKDGRDNVFFFNPYLAHSGAKITYSLNELFKNTMYKDSPRKREKDERK